MADKVLVIPATVTVGRGLPAYLPLANGDLKELRQCTRADIEEAVGVLRELARTSRERLEAAYQDHLRDVESLAQAAAYCAKFDQWKEIREGGVPREILWEVEL